MKALVLLADGCEELEAVSIIDVLRRGGVEVLTASISSSTEIHGAHGIDFKADTLLADFAGDFDLVAFPGGMGCMQRLRQSEVVLSFLRDADSAGKIVGAVCASPAVLGAAGLLAGRRYCCYPGIQEMIADGEYVPDEVAVRDGNIVTGTGPGTAVAFALALLDSLGGDTASVAAGLLA